MSVSTYTDQNDQDLLLKMRQNDEHAFSELFKRHWKTAYKTTFVRVRSEEITEEIVQDSFISIWEKRHVLEINNFSAYLHTMIKNKVLNYIESQVVRKKHWDYYKLFIPEKDEVTQKDVEWNELFSSIEEGINHLPEKSRKIFRLNHLEGKSISEIASNLKLSEKAIQYHLTQSVRRLRLHLKNYILTGFIAFILGVIHSIC